MQSMPSTVPNRVRAISVSDSFAIAVLHLLFSHPIAVLPIVLTLTDHRNQRFDHLRSIYKFGSVNSALRRTNRTDQSANESPLEIIFGDVRQRNATTTFFIGQRCLRGHEGIFCVLCSVANLRYGIWRFDHTTMLKTGPCRAVVCA